MRGILKMIENFGQKTFEVNQISKALGLHYKGVIYIKNNTSIQMMASRTVHEGVHGLDWLKGINQGTSWRDMFNREWKAYNTQILL